MSLGVDGKQSRNASAPQRTGALFKNRTIPNQVVHDQRYGAALESSALGNVNPCNGLMVANEIQNDRSIGRPETLNFGGLEMLKIYLAHC